jgi:hypothetical protein
MYSRLGTQTASILLPPFALTRSSWVADTTGFRGQELRRAVRGGRFGCVRVGQRGKGGS